MRRPDDLAVEEPLELLVGGRSLAVTMRTPGADFDLAAGFLVSEAVIQRGDQLAAMRYCTGVGDDGTNRFNVLDISLGAGVDPPDPALERAFSPPARAGCAARPASTRCGPAHPTSSDRTP